MMNNQSQFFIANVNNTASSSMQQMPSMGSPMRSVLRAKRIESDEFTAKKDQRPVQGQYQYNFNEMDIPDEVKSAIGGASTVLWRFSPEFGRSARTVRSAQARPKSSAEILRCDDADLVSVCDRDEDMMTTYIPFAGKQQSDELDDCTIDAHTVVGAKPKRVLEVASYNTYETEECHIMRIEENSDCEQESDVRMARCNTANEGVVIVELKPFMGLNDFEMLPLCTTDEKELKYDVDSDLDEENMLPINQDFEEQMRMEAERLKREEEERIEREFREEEDRIERARILEEERVRLLRIAEEERLERERVAEEERLEHERIANLEREEMENMIQEDQLSSEYENELKWQAILRKEEEERLERERIAEEERLERERIAEEERLERERIAEEQRLEKERKEQEERLERERIAELEAMESTLMHQEDFFMKELMAEERKIQEKQQALKTKADLKLMMEWKQQREEMMKISEKKFAVTSELLSLSIDDFLELVETKRIYNSESLDEAALKNNFSSAAVDHNLEMYIRQYDERIANVRAQYDQTISAILNYSCTQSSVTGSLKDSGLRLDNLKVRELELVEVARAQFEKKMCSSPSDALADIQNTRTPPLQHDIPQKRSYSSVMLVSEPQFGENPAKRPTVYGS
eukprot:GDKJ01035868.1.p1 GENE.GDKJ01035868.1~~GDKJ01035868.1.p1  ORF type:complete len:681 (+),score=210.76 GDKJ01035868.1:131-2044(+)